MTFIGKRFRTMFDAVWNDDEFTRVEIKIAGAEAHAKPSAPFSVRPTLRRIATFLMAAAQVKGACLIKERVLAGEVELAWDVRRSHPVPTALSDYDKFRRYTAFRPYLVYRHPEQSLQDSIARLRPRRFRRLSHLHPG